MRDTLTILIDYIRQQRRDWIFDREIRRHAISHVYLTIANQILDVDMK